MGILRLQQFWGLGGSTSRVLLSRNKGPGIRTPNDLRPRVTRTGCIRPPSVVPATDRVRNTQQIGDPERADRTKATGLPGVAVGAEVSRQIAKLLG